MPSARQSGSVLIIVLWSIGLVSVSGLLLSKFVSKHTHSIVDQQNVWRANSAIERIVYDEIANMINQSNPRDLRYDGTMWYGQVDKLNVRMQVYDDSSRIDLNHVKPDLLLRLLTHVGVEPQTSEQIADAILDWRDRDELTRVQGAEAKEYESFGSAVKPVNRPFSRLSEVLLVHQVDRQIWEKIKPFVTFNNGSDRISQENASSQMRQLLNQSLPEYARLDSSLSQSGNTATPKRFTIEVAIANGKNTVLAQRIVVNTATQQAFQIVSWEDSH